jgi:hypothetical protein
MKRQGFILGLFSVGGQVLLLRELVSSLNGDELFIGTALCGWLLAVALGAYLGGRIGRRVRPGWLFGIGAVLIPIMIVAVRLSPLAVTDLTGEIVPFITSVIISVLAMFPIGLISGWLFPKITNRVVFPVTSAIVTVYLYEGIGAFVGGIGTTVFAGGFVSTFTLGAVVGIIVFASIFVTSQTARIITASIIVAAFAAGAVIIGPGVDHTIDDWKYGAYIILASFDTRYGHETILSRDESVTLMTDNNIEAVHPDVEAAENQLLAPILYHPDAERVLYVGRPEFGADQLADSLGINRLAGLDPRKKLTAVLKNIIPTSENNFVIQDDPIAYLTTRSVRPRYDIIIVNAGGRRYPAYSHQLRHRPVYCSGETGGFVCHSSDAGGIVPPCRRMAGNDDPVHGIAGPGSAIAGRQPCCPAGPPPLCTAIHYSGQSAEQVEYDECGTSRRRRHRRRC